jgi:hypothetical protein
MGDEQVRKPLTNELKCQAEKEKAGAAIEEVSTGVAGPIQVGPVIGMDAQTLVRDMITGIFFCWMMPSGGRLCGCGRHQGIG